MSATPAHIDPRIRERRIEVRREAGLKRLRLILLGMGIVCALGLAYVVVTSPLFDVDHVRVTGTSHVTVAQVDGVAGVHPHDRLLFVNTGAIARRVEQLPWVRHASVTRELPGTVRIVVTEYSPSAYMRTTNGVLLVAADGRVLGSAREPARGLFEVRGVRRAPAPGNTIAPAGAASVVGRLPHALASQVVAVDVSGGGLALDLASGGAIRFGNDSALDAKAASALAVIEHLGAAHAHFGYIDVSTPDRPVSHD